VLLRWRRAGAFAALAACCRWFRTVRPLHGGCLHQLDAYSSEVQIGHAVHQLNARCCSRGAAAVVALMPPRWARGAPCFPSGFAGTSSPPAQAACRWSHSRHSAPRWGPCNKGKQAIRVKALANDACQSSRSRRSAPHWGRCSDRKPAAGEQGVSKMCTIIINDQRPQQPQLASFCTLRHLAAVNETIHSRAVGEADDNDTAVDQQLLNNDTEAKMVGKLTCGGRSG